MTTANTVQTDRQSLAVRTAIKMLGHLTNGTLTVHIGNETKVFGNPDSDGPHAIATVHDTAVFSQLLTGGTVAAAEAYMDGLWDSPDITKVVQLFAVNLSHSMTRYGFLQKPTQWILRLAHWLNSNNKTGSKKNIRAHYDLGNDLFESFLDDSMMYSAAIYPNEQATLAEAQDYRLHRICRKLDLQPSDHLLEIGTGWGSMAIHAAKHYGCRVTTTTISDEQFALAKARIEKEGLSDRITLLKEDYRDLSGHYDKVVSIEMIEAVGHKFLPGYFKKINSLLKDHGSALLQCITIPDNRYHEYKNSVDFIRKYIFPGGHLPSISLINRHIAEQTDMTVTHFEDITEHYARTLRDWHHKFVDNYGQLPADKYDRRFYRMWRYYLAYCEGGFKERAIGTHQIMFAKAGNRQNWTL